MARQIERQDAITRFEDRRVLALKRVFARRVSVNKDDRSIHWTAGIVGDVLRPNGQLLLKECHATYDCRAATDDQ